MSTAHDLAWCAGFFDGEGWVVIQTRNSKVNGKRYKSHYLRIGINHVAPEPLNEIEKILGGKLRYDKNSENRLHKDGFNRKPRYCWTASCNEAGLILKKLMPYFRNKNKVAELALEFITTIGKNGQKVSNDLLLYRLLLKEKISSLNAKD